MGAGTGEEILSLVIPQKTKEWTVKQAIKYIKKQEAKIGNKYVTNFCDILVKKLKNGKEGKRINIKLGVPLSDIASVQSPISKVLKTLEKRGVIRLPTSTKKKITYNPNTKILIVNFTLLVEKNKFPQQQPPLKKQKPAPQQTNRQANGVSNPKLEKKLKSLKSKSLKSKYTPYYSWLKEDSEKRTGGYTWEKARIQELISKYGKRAPHLKQYMGLIFYAFGNPELLDPSFGIDNTEYFLSAKNLTRIISIIDSMANSQGVKGANKYVLVHISNYLQHIRDKIREVEKAYAKYAKGKISKRKFYDALTKLYIFIGQEQQALKQQLKKDISKGKDEPNTLMKALYVYFVKEKSLGSTGGWPYKGYFSSVNENRLALFKYGQWKMFKRVLITFAPWISKNEAALEDIEIALASKKKQLIYYTFDKSNILGFPSPSKTVKNNTLASFEKWLGMPKHKGVTHWLNTVYFSSTDPTSVGKRRGDVVSGLFLASKAFSHLTPMAKQAIIFYLGEKYGVDTLSMSQKELNDFLYNKVSDRDFVKLALIVSYVYTYPPQYQAKAAEVLISSLLSGPITTEENAGEHPYTLTVGQTMDILNFVGQQLFSYMTENRYTEGYTYLDELPDRINTATRVLPQELKDLVNRTSESTTFFIKRVGKDTFQFQGQIKAGLSISFFINRAVFNYLQPLLKDLPNMQAKNFDEFARYVDSEGVVSINITFPKLAKMAFRLAGINTDALIGEKRPLICYICPTNMEININMEISSSQKKITTGYPTPTTETETSTERTLGVSGSYTEGPAVWNGHIDVKLPSQGGSYSVNGEVSRTHNPNYISIRGNVDFQEESYTSYTPGEKPTKEKTSHMLPGSELAAIGFWMAQSGTTYAVRFNIIKAPDGSNKVAARFYGRTPRGTIVDLYYKELSYEETAQLLLQLAQFDEDTLKAMGFTDADIKTLKTFQAKYKQWESGAHLTLPIKKSLVLLDGLIVDYKGGKEAGSLGGAGGLGGEAPNPFFPYGPPQLMGYFGYGQALYQKGWAALLGGRWISGLAIGKMSKIQPTKKGKIGTTRYTLKAIEVTGGKGGLLRGTAVQSTTQTGTKWQGIGELALSLGQFVGWLGYRYFTDTNYMYHSEELGFEEDNLTIQRSSVAQSEKSTHDLSVLLAYMLTPSKAVIANYAFKHIFATSTSSRSFGTYSSETTGTSNISGIGGSLGYALSSGGGAVGFGGTYSEEVKEEGTSTYSSTTTTTSRGASKNYWGGGAGIVINIDQGDVLALLPIAGAGTETVEGKTKKAMFALLGGNYYQAVGLIKQISGLVGIKWKTDGAEYSIIRAADVKLRVNEDGTFDIGAMVTIRKYDKEGKYTDLRVWAGYHWFADNYEYVVMGVGGKEGINQRITGGNISASDVSSAAFVIGKATGIFPSFGQPIAEGTYAQVGGGWRTRSAVIIAGNEAGILDSSGTLYTFQLNRSVQSGLIAIHWMKIVRIKEEGPKGWNIALSFKWTSTEYSEGVTQENFKILLNHWWSVIVRGGYGKEAYENPVARAEALGFLSFAWEDYREHIEAFNRTKIGLGIGGGVDYKRTHLEEEVAKNLDAWLSIYFTYRKSTVSGGY